MADERTRKLERAAAGGDVRAGAQLLREELRSGEATKALVRALAYAGDEAAREVARHQLPSFGSASNPWPLQEEGTKEPSWWEGGPNWAADGYRSLDSLSPAGWVEGLSRVLNPLPPHPHLEGVSITQWAVVNVGLNVGERCLLVVNAWRSEESEEETRASLRAAAEWVRCPCSSHAEECSRSCRGVRTPVWARVGEALWNWADASAVDVLRDCLISATTLLGREAVGDLAKKTLLEVLRG